MPVFHGYMGFVVMAVILAIYPSVVLADCTGGCTTTDVGGDVVHTFTSDGTFTPPAGVTSVRYLVVGGGGGGGAWRGGGGGAGGYLAASGFAVTALTPYNIVVGGSGAGAPGGTDNSRGSNGGNSSFDSITALGGGGGGIGENTNNGGGDGGSGGGEGGAGIGGAQGPGSGTGGQGNNGGAAFNNNAAAPRAGGGGGGAGAVGQAATNGQGGNGGTGVSDDITGTGTFYAGGGGGASNSGGDGTGGNGGGGAGNTNGNGQDGIANTGGGGGGAGGGFQSTNSGGAGGSGIVVIRYIPPPPPPDPVLHFQMEEFSWNGTTDEVQDDSGNGQHGTAVGGATTVGDDPAIAGSPGTCRYSVFDGVNDYVDVPNLSSILNSTASLAFWINTTQVGNDTAWMAPGITGVEQSGGGDDIFWGWLDASGRIGIAVGNAFGVGTRSTVAINNGVWRHVVLTRDEPAGTFKIYIDGTLDQSGTIATGVIGTAFSSVGRIEDTGGSPEYFDGLLDELRIYDEVLTDSDVLIIRDSTHPCPTPAPLAYYALDEDTWGTIIDSSGNGFDASALGSAAPDPYPVTIPPGEALTGDPGTCGAGFIPVTAGTQAIATPVEPDATISNTGSIAFWYSGNSNWNDSTDRMLFDASNNLGAGGADKHFYLVKRGGPGAGANNGSLRFAIEDSGDTNSTATTGQFTFAANTWVHITVTWDLPNDLIQIYVNGALAATSTTDVNGVLGNTATLYFGDQRMGGIAGTAGNYTINSANGYFDEIKIFNAELSVSDIAALMTETHPCTVSVHHYAISHTGTGVTCLAEQITFTGHDILHDPVDPGVVTVNLSTTTNRGNWSGVVSGTGTLTNSGNGAGTYEFPGGEESVTLWFNYTDIPGDPEVVFSESFYFNVTDGTATDLGNGDPEDPEMTFARAGFRFYNVTDNNTTILTQIAGKPSDVNPNSRTMALQAIRASDSDPSVCTAAFPDGEDRVIDLGAECLNPDTCAGQQVIINTNPIATSDDNSAAGSAAYTGVNLTFGPNALAEIIINYPDAGQIQLHAQYDIPLEDSTPSGDFMLGSSNNFVVRPFGLAIGVIENSDGDPNPGADTPAGNVFTRAGLDFKVSVGTFIWQAADDDGSTCDVVVDPPCAAGDGIPDTNADLLTGNAVTPNFKGTGAVDTTLTAVAPFAPNTGVLGQLLDSTTDATPVIAAAAFGASIFGDGIADIDTLYYTEVGSMTMQAFATDYLGTGENISGRSSNLPTLNPNNGIVGRFIPDRFNVTDNNPAFVDECPGANPFTYMSQAFYYGTAPELTITALNTKGDVTQNYGDTDPTDPLMRFWKLDSAMDRNYTDQAGALATFADVQDTDVILDGDLDFDGIGTLALENGTDGDAFNYMRVSEEGEFTADVDATFNAAALTDNDNVCYGPGFGTCEDYTIAGITDAHLRFGRLVIGSAAGSELLPVTVPLRTEYFNGTMFVINEDDNCTGLDLAVDIELSNPETMGGAPQPGDTTMTVNSGSSDITSGDPVTFTGGQATLTFSPPGANNTGYIDIQSTLDYLLDDTDDDGNFDDNPTGRATFGVFEGPGTYIYIREPW
jgi:MSHA biogenesis protein MshQ